MANLKGGDFDKFTVIKNADIRKYLTTRAANKLNMIKEMISIARVLDDKELNTYLVINTDEPYANEIIEILKRNGHWG